MDKPPPRSPLRFLCTPPPLQLPHSASPETGPSESSSGRGALRAGRKAGWCRGNGTVRVTPRSSVQTERSRPSSGPEFLAGLSAGKANSAPSRRWQGAAQPSGDHSGLRCTAPELGAAGSTEANGQFLPSRSFQSDNEHQVPVCNGEERPFFWMAGYSEQKVLLFFKLSFKHEELVTHHLVRWQKIF